MAFVEAASAVVGGEWEEEEPALELAGVDGSVPVDSSGRAVGGEDVPGVQDDPAPPQQQRILDLTEVSLLPLHGRFVRT